MTDKNKQSPRIAFAFVKTILDASDLHYDSTNLEQHWNDAAPCDIDGLRSTFRSAGIHDAQPVSLSFRRFDQRRFPALVLHENEWFLAFRPLGTPDIVLQSASLDPKKVSPAVLNDALVVWFRLPQPAPEQPTLRGNKAAGLVWSALFKPGTRGWLGQVVLATLLINLFAVFTSIFAMQVYDRVVPTQAMSTLTTLVVGMGLIILADWWLKLYRARVVDSLACSVDKFVSQKVFDHLSATQIDMIPRSLGQVSSQVQGLDSVRQFFSSATIFVFLDIPFAFLFLFFIAVIAGPVVWVYLAMIPLSASLGLFAQLKLRKLTHDIQIRSQERSGLLVDSLRGSETIRANNAAWRFSGQWAEMNEDISFYSVRHKGFTTLASISSTTLGSIAYVAAIVVGVYLIAAGSITMGALIACGILGSRVIAPFAQAAQQLTQWQNVKEALQMVDSLLKLPRDREEGKVLLAPDKPFASLVCEHVCYSYPGTPIRQLAIPQLTIRPGERILLVGGVGSGKTTLLRVLAGLCPPSEGRVSVSGADIWEIDPQVYTNQVGYLPQSVSLFKDTLRNNLTLSGLTDDDRVVDICHSLGLDQIALSTGTGYDHQLDEQGAGLSQGQRQLIGLGRLLIHGPRIWILDEPTSSLDPTHEKKVWDTLQRFVSPDDIVIISTHRLGGALDLCNRMLVMSSGAIVRDGDPVEVLASLSGQSVQSTPLNSGSGDLPTTHATGSTL